MNLIDYIQFWNIYCMHVSYCICCPIRKGRKKWVDEKTTTTMKGELFLGFLCFIVKECVCVKCEWMDGFDWVGRRHNYLVYNGFNEWLGWMGWGFWCLFDVCMYVLIDTYLHACVCVLQLKLCFVCYWVFIFAHCCVWRPMQPRMDGWMDYTKNEKMEVWKSKKKCGWPVWQAFARVGGNIKNDVIVLSGGKNVCRLEQIACIIDLIGQQTERDGTYFVVGWLNIHM